MGCAVNPSISSLSDSSEAEKEKARIERVSPAGDSGSGIVGVE